MANELARLLRARGLPQGVDPVAFCWGVHAGAAPCCGVDVSHQGPGEAPQGATRLPETCFFPLPEGWVWKVLAQSASPAKRAPAALARLQYGMRPRTAPAPRDPPGRAAPCTDADHGLPPQIQLVALLQQGQATLLPVDAQRAAAVSMVTSRAWPASASSSKLLSSCSRRRRALRPACSTLLPTSTHDAAIRLSRTSPAASDTPMQVQAATAPGSPRAGRAPREALPFLTDKERRHRQSLCGLKPVCPRTGAAMGGGGLGAGTAALLLAVALLATLDCAAGAPGRCLRGGTRPLAVPPPQRGLTCCSARPRSAYRVRPRLPTPPASAAAADPSLASPSLPAVQPPPCPLAAPFTTCTWRTAARLIRRVLMPWWTAAMQPA